jgi:hypothetical protein
MTCVPDAARSEHVDSHSLIAVGHLRLEAVQPDLSCSGLLPDPVEWQSWNLSICDRLLLAYMLFGTESDEHCYQ